MSRSTPARRSGRTWIALLAAVTLAVAACSGGGDGEEEQQADHNQGNQAAVPTTAPVTVTYASAREFSAYNNNTANAASSANAVVLNQVLRGFWYYGPEGDRRADTEFGSFEQVGSNPLTVEYTFADGAVWSDGEPIDCDDAVLAWAANAGRWPTGEKDQYTGAKLTAFSSNRPGAWEDAQIPECSDGSRAFTVTFDRVFADWSSLFGAGTILPAHIVEKQTGVKDLISAVKAGKSATMKKLGKFYNTGWEFTPGKYETAIAPSAGPYQVASWKAGDAVTLEPNPKWWGAPPSVRNIVVKVVPASEQAEALVDGDVQVIDPTPTEGILKTLDRAGDAVDVTSHDSFVYEHLDFNVDGVFKSRALREAFAKCVPRQQIVDELIKPVNPQAQVQESRFRLPYQQGYEQFAQTGGQDYDAVDVEGARKILKDEKKLGTRVELSYLTPDLRREQVADLIKKSCDKAGFKVVDSGSYTFYTSELKTGDFDVALFSWAGTTLVTQPYSVYLGKGPENYGGYSDEDVDLLLKRLYSELDPDRQESILEELDTELWDAVATVPLFAYPGMLATSSQAQGVQYNPTLAGVTYNANTWTLASTPSPSPSSP
ncbi:hypothetical protein KIH74_15970 [Kineosporia sp. J2-2]|uniref:Solute-binding protein family 5 domain-containing protein n=1 Tax=Kineosporia corallincola TaxID=2835133 RepID=A0ABS5TJR6_9ACTN|nr:ABC transporter substrate-binding protein [Kineosporia corallincola]MBT0770441.1 hypothetical protein [Kineosporia corallincola]